MPPYAWLGPYRVARARLAGLPGLMCWRLRNAELG